MMAVIMFLFGLRLVQVQALQANDYRARAVNEMEKVRTLQAPRGDITDINGVPFARSVAATSIVVDQTQILNPAKVAAFVAPILNLSVSEVQTALTGKRKWSMVAQNAKPATWLKLKGAIDQYNTKFPGMSPDRIIGFFPERSYIPEYPSGSLIASLIGFVNRDGVGATGLESSMNSTISGTEGKYSYANGYKAEIPGSQSEIIPAEAGTSIRLTVDRDIQFAAAIEEKKITPETVLTIPYALKRSVKTFHDHEPHPTQRLTTAGVLAVSSNTGSIKIGEMLSNDKLYDYLTKFGIGTKTGSGLPGESRGILPKVADWSGTTAPTVAFGQGYSLTAMQATSVFATIANDGVRVSPTVIAGTSDSSGNYTPSATRESVRVISTDTAAKMRLMMESVVSANGTAPSAAISGYRVAGKTGTAQRIDDTCGCYRGYTASFIGFAPADKPAYVISVTIQDPKGMHWGGYLGGPVFKKVMSFVLQSKGIAPTGTKVIPIALTEKQLLAERKLIADKKAASVKTN